jgi:hypothetical protein
MPSEKPPEQNRVIWWGIQINSARHMQKIEIIGVRETRDIFNPSSKCLVKS